MSLKHEEEASARRNRSVASRGPRPGVISLDLINELHRIRGITKRFGGTLALDRVSLSVERGECHALMGENGAGKSTLGRILAGIVAPDSGTLRIGGAVRRFHSPRDGRLAGIGMVHQELPTVRIFRSRKTCSWTISGPGRLSRHPAAGQARARVLLNGHRPGAGPLSAYGRPFRRPSASSCRSRGPSGQGPLFLVFDEPTSSADGG